MRLAFLILVCLTAPTPAAVPDTADARAKAFQAANGAYEAGNYQDAIQGYESLVAGGEALGAVHYNLGDAYFRQKALGRAIFHFRKAATLLPRDPDVKFNLGFARGRATDRIESRGFAAAIDAALPITEREALRWLLVAAVSFFGAGIARTLWKRAWHAWAQLATGSLFAIALTIAGWKMFATSAFGVVTALETGVYSGTGKDTTLLFSLHEGAEFVLSENGEGEWVRIQLADGKRGWVKKSEIAL